METVAAIIFMIGCGAYIFLAAFCWGAWKALFSLITFLIYLATNLGDVEMQRLTFQFFSIFSSFIEPFGTFFSETWKWAKYEHPVIAFFLGLISMGGTSQLK